MQEYEENVKNVAIKRKEIAQTLLQLQVQEKTDYDIIQYDSVRNGIQRLQKKFKGSGYRWSSRTIDTTIEVIRVA